MARRLVEAARSHAAAWLVFLICLSATILMALQVRETARAKDLIRFNLNVDHLRSDLNRRLATYVAMLRAGAGLLAAEPTLGRDEFRAFVNRIELQPRYPGVQGFGFTRRILPDELNRFTTAQRAQDPGFHVWPETPRPEYHAIVFLEPLDRRNRAAIGYDMFTEPVRREAMARARDTGVPAASGRVTLVQEIDSDKQAGFLIYVPVYYGGDIPATIEARRARLRGFVYSPFRIGDFVRGVFGTEEQPRVGFELYDERIEPSRLLYRSTGFDPRARFIDQMTLDVAGRTWAVPLTGTPALEDASARSFTPIVLMVGLSISLLLTGLTALQTRARQRLEQSEQQLAQTSQQFQQLADSIPQLVWMARADGRIYWYNRRWYEYTGTTLEQMQGWGWQRVHDPDSLPRVMDRWKQSLRTGEPFEMEFPLRSGAGEMRWFLTRVVPMRNAKGEVVQWFGTNTDVQTRREEERRLEDLVQRERALRSEAERVSRIKDEFLATLSHELRTPLNAIIGWVHLLTDGSLSDDAQRRALSTVNRNARQQARLIDDLLDMSRIVSGKVRLELREVDLNELVDAAVNVVRPAALANKITIDAPPDRTAPPVLGDPERLQQVLWNLLSNAVKFTPEGGRVQVRLQHDDREVQVIVSDTGIGIDPAFIPHVFDRFRQADGSSTREHGGLGLGLSIVKSLVEMHGGNVHASSEGPGRGATFTITLRAAPAVAGRDVPPPRATHIEVSDRLTGARVLVVEDDGDARELARAILERSGASVIAVESAEDALVHLNASSPDLIVSDLAMPGTDGFEFMRRVRRAAPDGMRHVPAIAVSAYARAEDRASAVEAGFDAYLAKPYPPEALVSSCAALLDGPPRVSS
jgi:PAS domain S-box-containing protein